MPHCHYLFLSGDGAGAGKTSIAMGLLHSLLHLGYPPSDLAYIKPATQCEAIQMVWKFCHQHGIDHVDNDPPVIYYAGFTHDVIDKKITESIPERRNRVKQAILKLGENKKFVIVDGVGYPAVGSCVGLSNADIASLINAPVLLVGKPGVGNAIDSMLYTMTFFRYNNVQVLGAIWNKIGNSTYHSPEDTIQYTTKYFNEHEPQFSIYGHLPVIDKPKSSIATNGDNSTPGDENACRRKMKNENDLVWKDQEEQYVQQFLESFVQRVDAKKLVADLQQYWQQQWSIAGSKT